MYNRIEKNKVTIISEIHPQHNGAMDELKRISIAVEYGFSLGLTVNAGHGLDCKNVSKIAQIVNINELNIGHSIIAESIFLGLGDAIKKMKNIITKESK